MNLLNNLKERISYDSILATPINQTLRYYPFVDFIKELLKKNNKLKILEVSSGASGITKYIKTPVVGIDISFPDKPSPYLKQLKHSALRRFPFKDNEFDVVLSVDGYEHLPKSKRRKTLEEMYRVSKKYMLLTTLFGETKWDRKVLTEWTPKHKYYRDIFEHKKMGFPSLNEIKDFLRNKKHRVKILKGIHPKLAFYLMLSEQRVFTMITGRTLLKLLLPAFKIFKGSNRLHFFIEKTE